MGYSDHTKATGAGGIMLIRVADSAGQAGVISSNEVQFFLRTTNSGTFVGSPGFGTSVHYNGAWHNLANMANYSGAAGFKHLGTIWVGYNQTITFHINASGTSGFGGPTDFPLWIQRATVPGAPISLSLDEITHQSARYRFSGTTDGGAGILEWQIGYGYNPTNVEFTTPSNGTTVVGGLLVGSTVYFWSRGRNEVGWSGWSDRMAVTLKRGNRVKHQGAWHRSIPYVKHNGVWKAAEPFIKMGKVPGVSDGTWKLADYT